jgi:hypothetical protein
MAVKSIIDIEVGDAAFKNFASLFEKYQAALAKSPAMWQAINKEIAEQRKGFEAIASEALVVQELTALSNKDLHSNTREVEKTAGYWRGIGRETAGVAGNIRDITRSLLKWTAITGLISGLAGAGGLFGIDRLALGVSAGRRSSLGLGLGYGEQAAFGNFSRLIDPSSFLSGVAGAKLDITKRVGLIGAGLTPSEIGGDTAQTGVALLQHLKQIADTTNPALYAQVIQSRQLGQFASPEDLQRLHNTSPEEFKQLITQYTQRKGQGAGGFDLPPAVQKAWQDLTTQLSNAGKSIETTFVRGLTPLAEPISRLSGAFERVVAAFVVKGGPLEKWIGDVGAGLERFAGYVGTEDFAAKVGSFVTGIGNMAAAIGRVLSWFGGPATGETHGTVASVRDRARRAREVREEQGFQPTSTYTTGAYLEHIFGGNQAGVNNPGNLRPPGASTGFAHFANPEAGIAAIARQIRLYGSRDHLDTISGIVSKYAPGSENDTGAYIKDVSARTGFAPGQHLDVNDTGTVAKLVAAIVSHEQKKGNYDRYKDAKVVVTVLNNTGGNANVSVNGLKN